MTIHFNTVPFSKLHGHQPRGVAIWIFYFSDAPEDPWIARGAGDQIRALAYSAAKAYATAEAMRRKVTSVRVDANPL